MRIFTLILVALSLFTGCHSPEQKLTEKIDRHALVTRHNVALDHVDTMGSLSVGNGEFAFTVDASGLQTFDREYENGIPLGTQTQWAWHRIPDPDHFSLNDVAKEFESCDGTSASYPVQHKEGKAAKATEVLRANPHRLHLGLIGLTLLKEDGTPAALSDLKNIRQTLNLWTGAIETAYTIDGTSVSVSLHAHPLYDGISVKVVSPLIEKKRLKISFRFPYGKDCHVCPGYDWNQEDRHTSTLTSSESQATIQRTLDSTTYYTNLQWRDALLEKLRPHYFELTPDKNEFSFTAIFSKSKVASLPTYTETKVASADAWKRFWLTGAAIDFSACTDPRARELERRVILSQYLTRIQCAGSLPPQETGLTMNSWYGKFHLEMHWWHATHFALWGRSEYIQKSLQWYNDLLPKAQATARGQGYKGARWQKMTDPDGNESPSSVGAFIIWQQPHPIYLAELLYRENNDKHVLNTYSNIVFNTAEFMVSFLRFKDGTYQLCHPLIPAQEIFKAEKTDNPGFELQYWHYALTIAQQWRTRIGLEPDPVWQRVADQLYPLPVRDQMYLPNSTTPDAYIDDQYRRDHPAILGAYGLLPGNERLDTAIMARTFNDIEKNWQWETTWGWDYPLMAMTAARLNKPHCAVNVLLMDVQKNAYLVNGHNYQDKRLRLYLPGNGGLLAAVAMMAGGWDSSADRNPGFPKDGKWDVRSEGLRKMP